MSRFLLAVMLGGVLLRFWNAIHDPSLWLDEAFSAKMAESPLIDLLFSGSSLRHASSALLCATTSVGAAGVERPVADIEFSPD